MVENQKMYNCLNPDILKTFQEWAASGLVYKPGRVLWQDSCRDNHETSSAWLFWPWLQIGPFERKRTRKDLRTFILASTISIIFCSKRVTHCLPPKDIQNICVQLSLHEVLSYISLEIITSPGDTSLP